MSRNTIIVRVMGGLGNQLFSYAAARRLALVNDCELVIDDVSGFLFDKHYKRTYQLNHFSIPCRTAIKSERLEPFSRFRRFVRKWKNKNKEFLKRDYIQQEVFDFDNRLIDFKPESDIYIEGYWQSENYFKDVEHVIRKDLDIIPPLDENNRNLAEQINLHKNSVAVHFRFFSLEKESDNNLSKNYYRHAINKIIDEVSSPHFFVFSDQPEKALEAIDLPDSQLTLINHNFGDNMAYADLWLMKQCRHFITANSTFSWWGAWLGEHPGKIVITPKLIKRSGVSWWGFKGLLPNDWRCL